MSKKILAILLCVCMVMSLAPAALAVDTVFGDVAADAWYADEVKWAYDEGLMNGTGDGAFSPALTTTRGMIVTILWRMEGEPEAEGEQFTDVAADAYYAKAIQWASANKIVEGYGAGLFGPGDEITREQLATIMYRYAQYKEIDVSEKADLSAYADADTVHAWAKDAMAWAVAAGLISGMTEDTLAPTGAATRAQVAVILYRLNDEVISGGEEEPEEPEEPEKPSTPSVPSYPVIPPAPPVHSHVYTYTSNDNGTHNAVCNGTVGTCDAENIDNEACVYGDDFACDKCGYVVEAKIGNKGYATAQDALDVVKSGETVELAAVDHGVLYVGRPTKDNGTVMECTSCDGGFTTTDAAAFAAHLADGAWHTTPRYTTTLANVTIVGTEGATVAGVIATSGHAYGDVYDYVLDKDYESGSAYYNTLNITNLKFSGVEFTGKVDINTSDETSVYDGVTFDGCTFTTGGIASDNGAAIRYYNEANNGKVKNLTVDDCAFAYCYQGVYVHHVNGVSVTESTFDTTGHNAIALQGHDGAVDLKTVEIIGNTFTGISDRVIRFNNIGADSQVTISDNTVTYSGNDDGEVAKATSLADGSSVVLSGNTWNGMTDAEAIAAEKIVNLTYKAMIGTKGYSTIQAAVDAVQNDETVVILPGTYTEVIDVTVGKTFTVKAEKADTVVIAGIDQQTNGDKASTVTFENLTIDNSKATEGWFTGTAQNIFPCVGAWGGNLSFENCTFEVAGTSKKETGVMTWWTTNKVTLSFNECTFNGIDDHENARAMQIYGNVDMTVTDCEFNTYKDYSLKYVGNEGCTATLSGNKVYNSENFAELGSSVYPGSKYTVNLNNNTLGEGVSNFIVANDEGQIVYVDGVLITYSKAGLEAAIAAATDETTITLAAGEYTLPSQIAGKTVTISGTEDTVIKTGNGGGSYVNLGGADVTFDGVTIKGQSSGQYNGYAHAGTMVYNNCVIEGTFTVYTDSTFNRCTFNLPKGCYVWTAWGANEVTYSECTFNTAGKALLVYHENGTCTVNVNKCKFYASAGDKAGAIANQYCAAIEIDNSGKGVGTNTACNFTVNTSENTIGENFSGEWRIKTYDSTGSITVNGTAYTKLALDGKTMTIDGDKNVTVQ